MSTRPDRLQTAAQDLYDFTAAVDAAVDDTLDELSRCSGDSSRAWVSIHEHLNTQITPEQRTKLLAAALIQIARTRGRR